MNQQKEAPAAIDLRMQFRYEGASRAVLRGMELTVKKGSVTVLCGSSGCGKSTVLRGVNHLIPQFYEGKLKGFCHINGLDTADFSVSDVGRMASSVFQDPRSQFFTVNSSTEVAFGPENFGYSHEEIEERVNRAFEDLGLCRLKNKNVFALSSGERQLVAILSAYAMDTDILLLDEPTANLDARAIRELSALLKTLKERGKTMLISEHRLSYLKEIADEFLLLQNGCVKERFTGAEMAALTPSETAERGLRTTDLGQVSLVEKPPVTPLVSHLWQGEHLSFCYGKKGGNILEDVSFTLKTGEVLALVGANGCGKTTLGKLTAGLLKKRGGSLLLDGEPLTPAKAVREGIFIMQEAEFQFFTNSVLHELHYCVGEKDFDESEVERLLRMAGLWECRHQHPFSLSGGQMQKLVLLLAYFSKKPLAVLDEPTAGLDYQSLTVVAHLINEMRKTKAVLLITHDLELIARVATSALSLKAGRQERCFPLETAADFGALYTYMETLTEKTVLSPPPPPKKEHLFDARLKLLLLLPTMALGIWGSQRALLLSFFVWMLMALIEGKWKPFLLFGGTMGLFMGAFVLFPNWFLVAFLVALIPRVILVAAAAVLTVGGGEAKRALAGLRKLHFPEKGILVASVIFRFFPVLRGDLALMRQSVKTRGFFKSPWDKVKSVPTYLEIHIVPMAFRAIRIAEALSASAETRGISLKVRRASFVALHFRVKDALILLLFILALLAGFWK